MLTLFFGFFKLFPLYAISIWKDTPYSIAAFMFSLCIANIVYKDGENLEKIFGAVSYFIFALLTCFLRNNGIYIVIVMQLLLMLVYRKTIFKEKKVFAIISIVLIVLTLYIQGPIYNKYNLNVHEKTESYGIPLQQICYVVAKDGEISEQEKSFIENIVSFEIIKQQYHPCIVDNIKWSAGFNTIYLNENSNEFLKVWASLFFKNPIAYIKAYLLETLGFWDINKATFDGYSSYRMFGNTREFELAGENLVQTDYIKEITGHTIENLILPSKPISAALFLYINLFSMLITIYKKRYKNLLIYLPGLVNWMTIMVATPLAFTLRYVYIFVMMMPIAFVIPFIKSKKEEE